MTNLELLVGPFQRHGGCYEGEGFVASIFKNLAGEKKAIRDRLSEERVPQMLRAAVETMIDVRANDRKMVSRDPWAMQRLKWISEWIDAQGLDQPSVKDILAAGLEYLPEERAA